MASERPLALAALLPSELLAYVSRPRAAVGIACVAASALLLWRSYQRHRHRRANSFTCVPGLPLLGAGWELIKDPDRFLETAERFAKTYGGEGVFELSIMGQRVVVICDYEEAQDVLMKRPYKVTRTLALGKLGLSPLVSGLFFVEGRQWSLQRKLISPTFGKEALESYFPAVSAVVGALLDKVGEAAEDRRLVNATNLTRKLNADVISKVAFGHDFGAVRGPSQEIADVATLLDGVLMRVSAPFPYWRIPGLASLLGDNAGAAIKRLAASLEKRTLAGKASHATLLAKLVEIAGADGLTHEELMSNLVVLFVAGTDTTSLTLAWTLYELARLPDLQEAVAQEALRVGGDIQSVEDLAKLRMIRAVWLEALRLHSVAPIIYLEPQEPVKVAGRTVSPGTAIWLLTREMTCRAAAVQKALGTDLDVFRPARWLTDAGGVVECPPFDQLAFGHGARICVGKNLANLVGPLVLVRLIRHFRIERWEGPPLGEKSSFVQCPDRDVELRFAPRS